PVAVDGVTAVELGNERGCVRILGLVDVADGLLRIDVEDGYAVAAAPDEKVATGRIERDVIPVRRGCFQRDRGLQMVERLRLGGRGDCGDCQCGEGEKWFHGV